MKRIVGYLILWALAASLLGLLVFATAVLWHERGAAIALAVFPGIPLGALVLFVVLTWAIHATETPR